MIQVLSVWKFNKLVAPFFFSLRLYERVESEENWRLSISLSIDNHLEYHFAERYGVWGEFKQMHEVIVMTLINIYCRFSHVSALGMNNRQ